MRSPPSFTIFKSFSCLILQLFGCDTYYYSCTFLLGILSLFLNMLSCFFFSPYLTSSIFFVFKLLKYSLLSIIIIVIVAIGGFTSIFLSPYVSILAAIFVHFCFHSSILVSWYPTPADFLLKCSVTHLWDWFLMLTLRLL